MKAQIFAPRKLHRRLQTAPMASVMAGLCLCAASAHAGASTFDEARASRVALTIRVNNSGVQGLGHFHPKRNPTLGPAIAAFGRPSARRPRYRGEGCEVFWKKIGLKIFFSYYGSGGKRAACQPHRGVAKSALIRGPNANRWRTSRGVAIGDSLRRLESHYPNAFEFEGAYWLATGYTPIGEGSSYPMLEATVRSGGVFSFALSMSPTYD